MRSFARVAPLFFDEILERQPVSIGPLRSRKVLRSLAPVDAVIDFRSNPKWLWTLIGSRGIAPRFAAAFVTRTDRGWRKEARHSTNARRSHHLVERVAGRVLPFDTHLPELPAARDHAARLLPPGRRYLGISPGTRASAKAWPFSRHVELAERVAALGVTPVFLIGPDENEEQAAVRQQIPCALLIGPDEAAGDLRYLPWLIHATAARLTACVAVEGGIGHLVSTQQTSVITLAGPTDARRWRPVTANWWLVDAADFGSRDMSAIPVDAVLPRVSEALRWNGRP